MSGHGPCPWCSYPPFLLPHCLGIFSEAFCSSPDVAFGVDEQSLFSYHRILAFVLSSCTCYVLNSQMDPMQQKHCRALPKTNVLGDNANICLVFCFLDSIGLWVGVAAATPSRNATLREAFWLRDSLGDHLSFTGTLCIQLLWCTLGTLGSSFPLPCRLCSLHCPSCNDIIVRRF